MNTVSICTRILAASLSVSAAVCVHAAAESPAAAPLMSMAPQSPQQRYVELWGATAVREMYRSGVPASITLAQGILESRSGLSVLASEGHNHFGIKCHTDWKGRTMKMDDDAKGECFRVYDSADQSFRDHSDFLRYRDRYKFLFDFGTEDYESWAYGLKKAGYATDPSYASKLITIIEDYDLARFDRMTPDDASRLEKSTSASVQDSQKPAEKPSVSVKEEKSHKEHKEAKEPKESRRERRRREKEEKERRVEQSQVIPDVIPESPNRIERVERIRPEASEEFRFSLSRQIYTVNGVAFVYSMEGETYQSIAEAFHLFPKEILSMNDLAVQTTLREGTVVFIQQKKNQAEAGLDKYIVEQDGELLRDICQRFAVKQKSVEKMNGFSTGHQLRAGDTIILRK